MDLVSPGQSVSLDALNEQTSAWEEAVRRAESGQSVAIISHGEHVADVVPSGELDRLQETIEVLSDPAARAALEEADRSIAEGDIVRGTDAIRALVENRKRPTVARGVTRTPMSWPWHGRQSVRWLMNFPRRWRGLPLS